jgi:hypothetical protein
LPILKHEVIAVNHTGTTVDHGVLHDCVRSFITAADCLVKEVNGSVARVMLMLGFNSGIGFVTGLSFECFLSGKLLSTVTVFK